jgi:rod shape-determining protein MreB
MARSNPLALGRDLAIDLGTANTLIYARGQGIVLNEPSVVAIDITDGRPVAVGIEAKRMMGRTPGRIKTIRPLKDGVIADFEVCEKMLRFFIQKVHASRWSKPRMVICVPSGITGVEQRAVQDAAEYAGARKPVHIIEEPMAAAIGADMPVHEPSGNMIVDIGGGTTEVAVISLGGIVTAQSVRVAGDELDDAVMQFVKKEFSSPSATAPPKRSRSTWVRPGRSTRNCTADIRGRDLISGLPRTIPMTTEQVREALSEPVSAIVDAVKTTLDRTPPELAADIMEQGIMITGGGALLAGLDRRLSHETGMPINIARDPLFSVVIGSGRALENIDAMRGLMSLGGDD